MIAHSGAFQVSLGGFGEFVFLRDTSGLYTVTGHLYQPYALMNCADVTYKSRGEDHTFGLCYLENWEPPQGFEDALVTGYT